MKVFLAFSAIFFAVQLDSVQGVHKCKPEVIEQINKLWEKEDQPKDLINQAIAAKKQNVIKTSTGYYPPGTTCAYTLFNEDGTSVTLTRVVTDEIQEDHEDVYALDGAVVEKGTGVMRYHVFSKGGVAAWYKCGNGADAEDGVLEGAVKVPNGITYNEDDVKTAERNGGKLLHAHRWLARSFGLLPGVVYPEASSGKPGEMYAVRNRPIANRQEWQQQGSEKY